MTNRETNLVRWQVWVQPELFSDVRPHVFALHEKCLIRHRLDRKWGGCDLPARLGAQEKAKSSKAHSHLDQKTNSAWKWTEKSFMNESRHGWVSALYLNGNSILQLVAKCLRRIINDYCFGEITTKDIQVFHVVAIHQNAMLPEKSISGKSLNLLNFLRTFEFSQTWSTSARDPAGSAAYRHKFVCLQWIKWLRTFSIRVPRTLWSTALFWMVEKSFN